jgi:lysosomal Pro-X carboxypeptidase
MVISNYIKKLFYFKIFQFYIKKGVSLPFGNESFSKSNIRYLTSEQALADYAYLIEHLKATLKGADKSPVIAFGGSYGGMLSAWFRMKYPNIVSGALAASAPIFQMVTDCNKMNTIITNTFGNDIPNCPNIIRSSWEAIDKVASMDHGLILLTKVFRLCSPLKSIDILKDWLSDLYGNAAMVDYPYAANFMSPLPSYPVKQMCLKMINTTNLTDDDPIKILNSIYSGINVYQNYTGDVKCFDLGTSSPTDIDMTAWTYQTCTEFVFPSCSDGKQDMFEASTWNYTSYREDCWSQYGVYPRPDWPIINYGGSVHDLKAHSNIIFSNGNLDPWSGGGVLESDKNERIKTILIEGGAHHLGINFVNNIHMF